MYSCSLDGAAQIPAYVARPAGTPKAAIIVIPEIFGLNPGIQQKCETWASEGYLALAPDIFWRFAPGVELDCVGSEIFDGDRLRQRNSADHFRELPVAGRELEPFDRQLRLMKICVGLAPLLGLFGTVTGMLATFAALASGSGGEQTMGAIAKGISEALITTETGLVVALPGLFLQYHLSRKKRGFEVFLDHAETICRRHATRAATEGATAAPVAVAAA